MRRVYYIYGISVVTNPMMLHGMAFSISLGIFAELVHVASIINNLLEMKVSGVPQFIWNAFARGEVLTIAMVGVMIFTALSVQWKIVMPQLRRLQLV